MRYLEVVNVLKRRSRKYLVQINTGEIPVESVLTYIQIDARMEALEQAIEALGGDDEAVKKIRDLKGRP